MRIACDTNVLVYAAGYGDERRLLQAEAALASLRRHTIVVPVQVLGEMVRVLTGKAKWEFDAVSAEIGLVEAFSEVVATAQPALRGAIEMIGKHKIAVWDAVILSVASEAGCSLLLSEDYNEGFVWRGVTVVNPFATTPHALLARAMREERA